MSWQLLSARPVLVLLLRDVADPEDGHPLRRLLESTSKASCSAYAMRLCVYPTHIFKAANLREETARSEPVGNEINKRDEGVSNSSQSPDFLRT